MKFLSVFVLCYLHYSISMSLPETVESPNKVSDSVLKLIEEKVKHIETFFDDIKKERQPINISNLDIFEKLKPLKGNWVLDKIILKDYYNWNRGPSKTQASVNRVSIEIPFYWPDYINIEIDHNGEIVIDKKYLRGDNDTIIKIENSKLLVSMKGLRVTVVLCLDPESFVFYIPPELEKVDVNSTVTGIYVDGEPSAHPLEKIIPELQNQQSIESLKLGDLGLYTLFSVLAELGSSHILFLFWAHFINTMGRGELDIESFANMDMQIFDEKLKKLYQNMNMNIINFMKDDGLMLF